MTSSLHHSAAASVTPCYTKSAAENTSSDETGFQLAYRAANDSSWTYLSAAANSTGYTFKSLKAKTTYYFYVWACNSSACSSSSNMLTAKTK